MPVKAEYINELERRYGSSPELDELRRRYTPNVYEGMGAEEAEKTADEVMGYSRDFGIPLMAVEEHYNLINEIADPDDLPDEQPPEKLDFTLIPGPEYPQLRQAPPPTKWQKVKGFFIGDLPALPPNADRIEKAQRALEIGVGTPLRTFFKFANGRLFGLGDLMWGGLKRIIPEDVFAEEVRNMTLGEATDWAMGYEPSGFANLAGEIAEFSGRIQTAQGIGVKTGILGRMPKSVTVIDKALETAKVFGLAATAEQIKKAAVQKIDPSEAEYGYEGPKAVLRDMAIGAVFSFLHSGVKGAWSKLTPTEHARALKALGLKKGATTDEIRRAARNIAKQYHPDKVEGMRSEFEAIIKARDVLLEGEAKDVVFRGQKITIKPKLLPGEVKVPVVAVKAPVPPVEPTKPIVPAKVPAGPLVPTAKPGEKPILTSATLHGSIIYMQFDSTEPIPSVEELKKFLSLPDANVAVGKKAPGFVSTIQGGTNFQINVSKLSGPNSSALAQKVFNAKIGPGNTYKVETALERALPLKERFTKVAQAAVRAETGAPPTEAKPPIAEQRRAEVERRLRAGEEVSPRLREEFADLVKEVELAKPPPQVKRLGPKEAGATTIISDVATEVVETNKRMGSTLANIGKGVKEIFSRNVKRFADHLKTLGARGEVISKDLDEITQRAQVKINNTELDAGKTTKGVSKENRERIAKAMNKRLAKVPQWIQERANKLSAVLDKMMNEAAAVGIQRKVGGQKVEIRGAGKAFPQVPNAEGEKFLKLAGNKGLASPRVVAVAEQAVKDGKAGSVEEYVAGLQRFRENQLRGTSSYLEQTRIELPEEMVEWDPDRVLDALIQKTWLLIEGTRQWGADKGGLSFPKLAGQVEGIRQFHSVDEAKEIERFVKAAFGQDILSTEAARKISGAVRGYQFLTKIAVSPLTITRNMLDRYAKASSLAPFSVILKSTLQYPPLINAFIKHSREIEEEMIRRGAVFSNTALGEGYQPGHLLTKIAGKAFASSERGNQVFIALVKKNAIDFNLRLLRTNPNVARVLDERFGRILTLLETVGRAPSQAVKRLRGLGNEEFLAKLESVDDIPTDLLNAVLHRTVRDHAFPVVLSTKRSWWDNKPFVRMLTQFKIWGTDQVGHVWNDVIKDAVQNRDPSKLIRWLITMAMIGELYNILRDFILGRDESLLATLSDKERRNLRDISITILKDMLDGGVVGILIDVIYGLPNLIGGPTFQTGKTLGEAVVKTIWNPSQAKDALKQLALKETPALRQAMSALDKIDAQYNKKNLTQDYYKIRRKSFEWKFKKEHPKGTDKAKAKAVQALLGWTKAIPQERTLSYQMAVRQIMVGDVEQASEHLFFLLKTADTPAEQESIEKGMESALNNASPLGKVAERDLAEFFSGMSNEQQRAALAIQLRWDSNVAEAKRLAITKWQEWNK